MPAVAVDTGTAPRILYLGLLLGFAKGSRRDSRNHRRIVAQSPPPAHPATLLACAYREVEPRLQADPEGRQMPHGCMLSFRVTAEIKEKIPRWHATVRRGIPTYWYHGPSHASVSSAAARALLYEQRAYGHTLCRSVCMSEGACASGAQGANSTKPCITMVRLMRRFGIRAGIAL